jgi:hypothetical protein
LTQVITKLGKLEEVITISAVDCMFKVVVDRLLEGDRWSQKQWISVVGELRRKDRQYAFINNSQINVNIMINESAVSVEPTVT